MENFYVSNKRTKVHVISSNKVKDEFQPLLIQLKLHIKSKLPIIGSFFLSR